MVWDNIPDYARRIIRRKQVSACSIWTPRPSPVRSRREPDLQVRMQGIVLLGVFLKATPFLQARNLGEDELMAGVEKSLRKYFGKRSEQVVQENLTAVRRGYAEVREIPRVDHRPCRKARHRNAGQGGARRDAAGRGRLPDAYTAGESGAGDGRGEHRRRRGGG